MKTFINGCSKCARCRVDMRIFQRQLCVAFVRIVKYSMEWHQDVFWYIHCNRIQYLQLKFSRNISRSLFHFWLLLFFLFFVSSFLPLVRSFYVSLFHPVLFSPNTPKQNTYWAYQKVLNQIFCLWYAQLLRAKKTTKTSNQIIEAIS